MNSWLRRRGAVVAVPIILSIGWLDYRSGPELGLSLFYLIPIAAVAWYSGRWQALLCAVTAAVCWQGADVGWRAAPTVVSVWNGFTRLVIYTATAWLVDQVQVDRRQLTVLNDDLEQALDREKSLARTDPVTFLPNSRAFLEHMQSSLARFAQEHCTGTLLFLDLDNFKSVNDVYGHGVGDAVLGRVAGALQGLSRGADIVARIGGDEFAYLVWHADERGADETLEAIEAAVDEIAADYPEARLGVSIGLASISDRTRDSEEIIRIADQAMYDRKAARKRQAELRADESCLRHG